MMWTCATANFEWYVLYKWRFTLKVSALGRHILNDLNRSEYLLICLLSFKIKHLEWVRKTISSEFAFELVCKFREVMRCFKFNFIFWNGLLVYLGIRGDDECFKTEGFHLLEEGGKFRSVGCKIGEVK